MHAFFKVFHLVKLEEIQNNLKKCGI